MKNWLKTTVLSLLLAASFACNGQSVITQYIYEVQVYTNVIHEISNNVWTVSNITIRTQNEITQNVNRVYNYISTNFTLNISTNLYIDKVIGTNVVYEFKTNYYDIVILTNISTMVWTNILVTIPTNYDVTVNLSTNIYQTNYNTSVTRHYSTTINTNYIYNYDYTTNIYQDIYLTNYTTEVTLTNFEEYVEDCLFYLNLTRKLANDASAFAYDSYTWAMTSSNIAYTVSSNIAYDISTNYAKQAENWAISSENSANDSYIWSVAASNSAHAAHTNYENSIIAASISGQYAMRSMAYEYLISNLLSIAGVQISDGEYTYTDIKGMSYPDNIMCVVGYKSIVDGSIRGFTTTSTTSNDNNSNPNSGPNNATSSYLVYYYGSSSQYTQFDIAYQGNSDTGLIIVYLPSSSNSSRFPFYYSGSYSLYPRCLYWKTNSLHLVTDLYVKTTGEYYETDIHYVPGGSKTRWSTTWNSTYIKWPDTISLGRTTSTSCFYIPYRLQGTVLNDYGNTPFRIKTLYTTGSRSIYVPSYPSTDNILYMIKAEMYKSSH